MLELLLSKAPPGKQDELRSLIDMCTQRGLSNKSIDPLEDPSQFCALHSAPGALFVAWDVLKDLMPSLVLFQHHLVEDFGYNELNEVKQYYPRGFLSVDKEGRPVYIGRLGKIDLERLTKVTTLDRYLKCQVEQNEKTITVRFPACSAAANKLINRSISIIDVVGVSFKSFTGPVQKVLMQLRKIYENYPATLNKMVIIHAGPGVRFLWNAAKCFVDPDTVSKVQVLGHTYRAKLLEMIDERL